MIRVHAAFPVLEVTILLCKQVLLTITLHSTCYTKQNTLQHAYQTNCWKGTKKNRGNQSTRRAVHSLTPPPAGDRGKINNLSGSPAGGASEAGLRPILTRKIHAPRHEDLFWTTPPPKKKHMNTAPFTKTSGPFQAIRKNVCIGGFLCMQNKIIPTYRN